MDPRIKALLDERKGYVVRNLPDRVAQVDADLAGLGYVDPDQPETTALAPPPETATPPRPQPRRSNPNAR